MAEPRLALVILAVDSLPRSVEFYVQAFGWAKAVDTAAYVELALPAGMRMGLYEREAFGRNIGEPPAQAPSGPTATELYLVVDDVEATFARVLAAGGRMLSPVAPRGWGDVVGYVADPDGNVVAVASSGR